MISTTVALAAIVAQYSLVVGHGCEAFTAGIVRVIPPRPATSLYQNTQSVQPGSDNIDAARSRPSGYVIKSKNNLPAFSFAQMMSFSRFKWIALFLAIWFGYPKPGLKYEQDIVPIAKLWAKSSSNDAPLKGVKVALTGPTSGIGLGLVKQLTNLGATIIALGRSPEKLQALKEQFPGKDIVPIQVQLSDLESVKNATKEMEQKYDSIDVLINNAGTNYIAEGSLSPTTAQNMDLPFCVNYLSHFLLSERMIPLLARSKFHPTIVQISSSYHWAVDGSELVVNEKHKIPLAAQPKGRRGIVFKTQRAYANSKLAQIMHARSLQRRRPNMRVKSICPTFVSTPIVGPTVQKFLLEPFAFESDGYGIKSALTAIFDLQENGDFVTNSGVLNTIANLLPRWFYSSWAYKLRIRDILASLIGLILLQTQRFFFASIRPRRTSPEAENETTQEALYQWSYETVKPYL